MPMPASQATQALLSRVEDVAQQHFGGDAHYLATAVFGSVLLEEHLAFLDGFDPDNRMDVESVRVLLEMSKLVDCVQDGSPQLIGPERDQGYVSDRYRTLAKNIEFAPAPLGEADRAEYERALAVLFSDPALLLKTDAYARFCVLRSDLSFKELDLLEKRRQLRDAAGPEKNRLTVDIADLEALVATTKAATDALDREHGFRDAEEVREQAERRVAGFPEPVKRALDTFELYEIADATSNETHVACSFFPSGLAEDNWTTLRLGAADLAATPDPALAALRDLLGFDSLGNAKIEALMVEIQMLSVERPWFWPELFANRQWRWAGASEPVSAAGGKGLIPSYVTGLVFARKLTVHGTVPTATPGGSPLVIRPQVLTAARPAQMMAMKAVKPSPTLRQAARPMTATMLQPQLMVAAPATRVVAQPAPALQVRSMKDMVRFKPNAAMVATLNRLVTVVGRVVAANGQPVSGASVTLRQLPGGAALTKLSGADGLVTMQLVGGGNVRIDVGKPGFQPLTQSLVVHNHFEAKLVLQPLATSHDLVVKLTGPTGKPFTGDAELLITSMLLGITSMVQGVVRRESASGRAELRIPLEPGQYQVAVTSAGARSIQPPQVSVQLDAERSIGFRIDNGLLLEIPQVQLLSFVCREVQASPNPLPGLFR
jgi:hypothetical protein